MTNKLLVEKLQIQSFYNMIQLHVCRFTSLTGRKVIDTKDLYTIPVSHYLHVQVCFTTILVEGLQI